jgi:hypothetical protein
MNHNKHHSLYLGLILFIAGLAGVLSLLTVEIPLPEEFTAVLSEQFSAFQIRILSLMNPLIMLIVAIVAGIFLHEKAGLDVPVIKSVIKRENITGLKGILGYGIIWGAITGALLVIMSYLFTPLMPAEFIELGENLELTLMARFLYGGITEEILMRFGLMTFFIWLIFKISGRLHNWVYWSGILAAALIFAVAHFPVAFNAVEEPSVLLLSYILIGNSLGGIVFGWLYWKKGLEAAFAAHIMAHVVMVLFL